MARTLWAVTALPAILALSSLILPTIATSSSDLKPREDDTEDSTGYPRCYVGHGCPGLWPSVNPDTPPDLNATLFDAINDAALLARSALSAMQASHFDYFFERNETVVNLLTTIFTNVASCAEGNTCKFSLVFPDNKPGRGYGWCEKTPAPYSYAPAGTTQFSSRGGGSTFMCPKGLALPRNPTPCTTDGNPTISLGFALLRALVQEMSIVDPDNSGTLFDGFSFSAIKELKGNVGDWDLASMGWGTAANGLMGQGVANAANLAYFATLSWDLGYGPAPWTGTKCPTKWTQYAEKEELVPVDYIETGSQTGPRVETSPLP